MTRRPPRWFGFCVGALVGPVLATYLFDVSARAGVVTVVTFFALGVLYVLNAEPA